MWTFECPDGAVLRYRVAAGGSVLLCAAGGSVLPAYVIAHHRALLFVTIHSATYRVMLLPADLPCTCGPAPLRYLSRLSYLQHPHLPPTP